MRIYGDMTSHGHFIYVYTKLYLIHRIFNLVICRNYHT